MYEFTPFKMIEDAKTKVIWSAENQQLGKYETSSPDGIKQAVHISNNNKYIIIIKNIEVWTC